MNQKKRCRMLAEKISVILREGFGISPEVLHYIDSTFSYPCAGEIHRIIEGESDCEKDSLIELIFFPDEIIQVQLEDFLEGTQFKKEDEALIAEALTFRKPEISICFPDNRGALELVMPESAVRPFIARLNISKKIDLRVIEGIRTFVSENDRNLCKVKVRNSRFAVSEIKIDFLHRFLEKAGTKGDTFFDALEFILNFLDDVLNDKDIFTALMERRRFYIRNLQKAEKFEEQFKEKNMEILIMQGLRAPYLNKEDAKKKIVIIDSISLAVFGKTDYVGQSIDRLSVDISQRHQDGQKMVRLLS